MRNKVKTISVTDEKSEDNLVVMLLPIKLKTIRTMLVEYIQALYNIIVQNFKNGFECLPNIILAMEPVTTVLENTGQTLRQVCTLIIFATELLLQDVLAMLKKLVRINVYIAKTDVVWIS